MRRTVRAGVLGHWWGNIGHQIMALGVESALKQAFKDQVACEYIEQHRPFDIYPKWHPLRHVVALRHARGGRIAGVIKRVINRREVSQVFWRSSWVGTLDLGVACGGPLITPHVSRGDLGLMFHHMFGAFVSKNLPLLNLSVGSCYPWEKTIKAKIDDKDDEDFLKRVFEYSRVTTVRDQLAQHFCAELGERFELVPDTGLIAGKAFSGLIESKTERHYIVINYQKHGANNDWGQHVDQMAWRDTMKNLVDRIYRYHKIIFVCHNDTEMRLAEELNPIIPRYMPSTMKEYAQIIAGAIAGICNRIHAAIPLASIGVPAIGVGTDSRLGTLQALGLKCFYVKEVTAALLEETLEKLIHERTSESERLMALREATMRRYTEIIGNAVAL